MMTTSLYSLVKIQDGVAVFVAEGVCEQRYRGLQAIDRDELIKGANAKDCLYIFSETYTDIRPGTEPKLFTYILSIKFLPDRVEFYSSGSGGTSFRYYGETAWYSTPEKNEQIRFVTRGKVVGLPQDDFETLYLVELEDGSHVQVHKEAFLR